MIETRAKTGKLPPKKIISFDDPEESEEEIESVPVAEVAEVENEPVKDVVVAPPRPVFEKFSTRTKLEEGICVVRPLGGGKYELVNLSKVDLQRVSSEEVGRQIKNTPSLLNLLNLANNDWDHLKLKSGQAVASANAGIFRLQKLPIELRYRIYDFAIISPKTISFMRWRGEHTSAENKIGLNLRATCKQIHEETEKFFFRNTFAISLTKEFKSVQKYICDNVREVTWDWVGFSLKDQQLFDCLNYSCPKLKVLKLRISWLTIDNSEGHRRRQYSHRDVPEAKRFRNTGGFDALVSLRGLELVTVELRSINIPANATMTQQEVDDFAAWLNTILTQEKYQPPVRASIPKKGTAASTLKEAAKKTIRRSFDGDGDDGAWGSKPKTKKSKTARA